MVYSGCYYEIMMRLVKLHNNVGVNCMVDEINLSWNLNKAEVKHTQVPPLKKIRPG